MSKSHRSHLRNPAAATRVHWKRQENASGAPLHDMMMITTDDAPHGEEHEASPPDAPKFDVSTHLLALRSCR